MSKPQEVIDNVVSQLQDLQTEDLPEEVKETLEAHASDLKALSEELSDEETD